MRVQVEVRAREMHAATDDGVTPILGGDVCACIDARPQTRPSRVPGCLRQTLCLVPSAYVNSSSIATSISGQVTQTGLKTSRSPQDERQTV